MHPNVSPLIRPVLRPVILAIALVVAASAWFGPFTLPGGPAGPVAGAASTVDPSGSPPASSSASHVASTPASPSTSPRPRPTPSPVVTAGPAPVPTGGSGTAGSPPTGGASRPVIDLPRTGPPSATAATGRALSLRLDSLRATYGLPGVSVAIRFADGSTWTGTSGLADVETGRPVTPDTEFAVASISKTFLAALILALAEDDQLELETPVVSYLPDLAIDPAITVRQLLDHTSGLHDYFYDPDIDKALLADREAVWTAEDALGYVGKPYFKPGKGWHYSNTNYLVLGLLAEAIDGAPVAEQLHSRFLTPLGLDHTHYQGVDDPLGPLARAYRFNGPGLDEPAIALTDGTDVVPFTSVVTAAGSAGSIASMAEDLVTWAKALYDGGVLSPASLAAMVADVELTAPFKPSIPYGLGVQAATIDGRPTLGHSGRLLGSRTVVRWLPDERIAIAVLTNQSRNDPNVVARALLRVVLGGPSDCPTCSASR
ncbi:MAG: serine hydrolase domain-containing protein [Candidatus Limnocylindrales bacterium]